MIVVVRSANECSLARSFAEQTTTYFRRRRINSQPLRCGRPLARSIAEQTTAMLLPFAGDHAVEVKTDLAVDDAADAFHQTAGLIL